MLETGLLGFALYCLFFVYVFVAAGRRQKNGEADTVLCQMAMVMAVMSIFFIVYNVSMRTESAYLVYFILSLPFLKGKNTDVQNGILNENKI